MDKIEFKKIGIIHSQFKTPKGTPIQPTAAKDIEGKIEILPQYVEGLKDLDGFSHIILLYHFHMVKKTALTVKPFLENKERGVFATRAPNRPNTIGLSIVRLTKIEGNILYIKDTDIVDGTPLIDIKPFVTKFDLRKIKRNGWIDSNSHKLLDAKDDGRFIK